MNKIIQKKLKIAGMHCSSCAMSIDFDLEDLDGVEESKTSYAKAECEVKFDSDKISLTEIQKQIKKSGYEAEVLISS